MTKQTLVLHSDTNLIHWFAFPIAALKRRKEYALMLIASLVLSIFVSLTMAPPIISLFLVPSLIIGIPIAFTVFLDRQLATDVVVYRHDSSGNACEDFQRWWVEDSLTWPDSFKFDFNGRRILIVDALDPENLKPFDPWIAPPPGRDDQGKLPITGTRVASVRSQSAAVTRISKFRPVTRGQQIQQGLMVIVIGASLMAIFMAADRVAQVMGYGR